MSGYIPTDNVLINGLRVNAETGKAIGDVTLKTVAALKGVAAELGNHDLQLSEIAQVLAILKQFHGIEDVDGALNVVADYHVNVSSAEVVVQQDITSAEATAG